MVAWLYPEPQDELLPEQALHRRADARAFQCYALVETERCHLGRDPGLHDEPPANASGTVALNLTQNGINPGLAPAEAAPCRVDHDGQRALLAGRNPGPGVPSVTHRQLTGLNT
jgi:hypothetical protein